MHLFFIVVPMILIGSYIIRFVGVSGIEMRLKVLRPKGRGHSVPNLFSPWEQLQSFWWLLSGEFRHLKDRQASLWGRVAQVGAIGALFGGGLIVVGLALLATGVVRN